MKDIITLTPSSVAQILRSDGLNALGLTTLSLSPRWSDKPPEFNSDQLTLTIKNGSNLYAPFRGLLEFAFSPASSKLLDNINATDTILKIAAAEGNKFPSLPSSSDGRSFVLTLSNDSVIEDVECTARSEDGSTVTFTVARGVNNTTAQKFPENSRVRLRLTKGNTTDAFYGVDCEPLLKPPTAETMTGCAVFRLHPQAFLRLQTLAAKRYANAGNKPILPIPCVMVVRGAQGFTAPSWFDAENLLTDTTKGPIFTSSQGLVVSFHDNRGLIVDPIYVAALFTDLQTWLPALAVKSSNKIDGDGGVKSIADLDSGVIFQCVDLHGARYVNAFDGAKLVTKNNNDIVTGTIDSSPSDTKYIFTLNKDDGIAASDGDEDRLRWGWATNGKLARDKLTPTLPTEATSPPSLKRQFYRVAVVDTAWALLGNRTGDEKLNIGGDDQKIPPNQLPDQLPKVRDKVAITYLTDGPDVLGMSTKILAEENSPDKLLVSPVIDSEMLVPSESGDKAHWPKYPDTNTEAEFPSPSEDKKTQSPLDEGNIKAAWSTERGNDVVVTLKTTDVVPDGASVRIFPRSFVKINAIANVPSFVRADGGTALVKNGETVKILLHNPFDLTDDESKPAKLTFDLVITPRKGRRKVWGGANVSVNTSPVDPGNDMFSGGNLASSVPLKCQSIAPSPLFGTTAGASTQSNPPNDLMSWVKSFISENPPRQGPRLPTMARFETIVVSGKTGGMPLGSLLWEAVLTGGRWARETRSAMHSIGNPGNPAGPDVHAAGIHVTGALAYDLARHSMRRSQPIILLGDSYEGWMTSMQGDDFEVPKDSEAPEKTGIGSVLETIAPMCETTELYYANDPNTYLALVQSDRLKSEIRHEFLASKYGQHDTLWSLRRAVRQARELIYIESPQFSRTAYSESSGGVDLVAEILRSLKEHAYLKVIICTPRESDFSTEYTSWCRQHFKARLEAVNTLINPSSDSSTAPASNFDSIPERVAVFHPVGFPGRPAFIRTTSVIVDDVWSLVGATHWRRRGMTFDGSVAIASFDRQLESGYSKKVREFRRALMAAKLGIQAPGDNPPSADWLRLGTADGSFELVSEWLRQGGLGKIYPLWTGPSDNAVLTQSDDNADPNGLSTQLLDIYTSLVGAMDGKPF